VYKLRRVDIERVPEILRRLEEYVGALVEELNPHLVILFGSFARGEDINEGSDIDLLVVADFQEDFLGRIGRMMRMNRFKIPVEPVGYTPEEFMEMIEKRNPFILDVLERGRIIYKNETLQP
jgi:predicted nucleotidyltransferase